MAIRGNLAEAALADVVQLLALGRRTGRLSAARDAELGTMFFVDGAVAHAALAHRRDPLGAALVRGGLIDDADLRAALAEQAAEPDVPLGTLLVRRGCVTHDVLRAQLATQAAEAAYEMLAWDRGTFSFEIDAAPPCADLSIGLDAGALLLEAARRADEGVLIATEVPGPTSVFAPACEPSDSSADDPDPHAARVLAYIDGRRDVHALADATGLSPFHVSRALHSLVRTGRVRRVVGPLVDAGSPRLASARADEHLNLGIAFARAGLLDEALRELRRVLELRPNDAMARGHLGAVAIRSGRLDEAAAVLNGVMTRPGATAAALHALGVVRHRMGHLALAEEAYEAAARRGLASDPRHLTARAALALDQRDWSAARRWLDDARTHWPTPPAVWYHYAVLAALGAGDVDGAGALSEAGVAAHPRSAALLANAAALAAQAPDEASAATARARVMTALADDPALAPAQRLLGDLHYRAGRLDDSRVAYEAATRLAPDGSALAWARLGSLALRAGDHEQARHAWTRACSLQPDHPTARANLDALRRADGSPSAAT